MWFLDHKNKTVINKLKLLLSVQQFHRYSSRLTSSGFTFCSSGLEKYCNVSNTVWQLASM